MFLWNSTNDEELEELFGRIRAGGFVFQNKICPFLAQGVCVYVGHSFFMKHSWTKLLYCWVCQMLHETSFQIINIYFISGQNRASQLL
jgi:hypothetical protein